MKKDNNKEKTMPKLLLSHSALKLNDVRYGEGNPNLRVMLISVSRYTAAQHSAHTALLNIPSTCEERNSSNGICSDG